MRNLVVGYVSASQSSQQQALGIIATVLDFTQEDRQRTGLDPNTSFGHLKQQVIQSEKTKNNLYLQNQTGMINIAYWIACT